MYYNQNGFKSYATKDGIGLKPHEFKFVYSHLKNATGGFERYKDDRIIWVEKNKFSTVIHINTSGSRKGFELNEKQIATILKNKKLETMVDEIITEVSLPCKSPNDIPLEDEILNIKMD